MAKTIGRYEIENESGGRSAIREIRGFDEFNRRVYGGIIFAGTQGECIRQAEEWHQQEMADLEDYLTECAR